MSSKASGNGELSKGHTLANGKGSPETQRGKHRRGEGDRWDAADTQRDQHRRGEVDIKDKEADTQSDKHRRGEGGREDMEADTECGFGCITPGYLQWCANIHSFTTFNSFGYMMMSTLGAYVGSQVTTLERQFDLNSKQTALILTSNKVIYICCVLLASYVGSRVHIPRVLGLGVMITGLSGIICSLPHFIFGADLEQTGGLGGGVVGGQLTMTNVTSQMTVPVGKYSRQLCAQYNISDDGCSTDSGSGRELSEARQRLAHTSMVIIVSGMMLHGLGRSPRFSYAVTYTDDNTARTSTGFNVDTHLNPKDSDWVGAWWLGFVLLGIVSMLASLPLFCFPRRLPKPEPGQKTEEQQPMNQGAQDSSIQHNSPSNGSPAINNNDDDVSVPEVYVLDQQSREREVESTGLQRWCWIIAVWRTARNVFFLPCLRLLGNPVYMLMNAGGVFIIFAVSGTAYSAKYLERVFDMPAYKANYTLSAIFLVSKCLGTFLGGYFSKRLKLSAYGAIKTTMAGFLLTLLANLAGLLFYCDQPTVHRAPGSEGEFCADYDCSCAEHDFLPICGSDGKTYFSPCRAQCHSYTDNTFANCSCIPGDGQAKPGMCDYGCDYFYPYVVFACLCAMVQTFTIMPKTFANCSCIPGDGQAKPGMCDYGCDYFYPYVVFACLCAMVQTFTIMPKVIVFIRVTASSTRLVYLFQLKVDPRAG
ncbi:solute carrier organic anion transporter family member 3A1-like [Aplysia californica]|uniref:Solute carrier organic anion transporter family member 3A1-like n=1 Tax=Aplysia californica TaxID=6500 RepID=A0ABM0JKC3_APLCA|nr:solute carrier organic anion transporter family member 3A1-like [Aplysia californica]